MPGVETFLNSRVENTKPPRPVRTNQNVERVERDVMPDVGTFLQGSDQPTCEVLEVAHAARRAALARLATGVDRRRVCTCNCYNCCLLIGCLKHGR